MFESLREPVSNEKMEFDLTSCNFPLTFQNEATVGISFESLKELVSNEEIKVEDEKDVFDLIIKWTKHDRDKRMDFFSELFEQVASFDRTYKPLWCWWLILPIHKILQKSWRTGTHLGALSECYLMNANMTGIR